MAKSPQIELEKFIDRYTPDIASLARAALTKLMDRIPGAQVLVYDNYNALAIGFGPGEKTSEAILSLALYPRWVSLFFLQGAGLPDPDKILKGSGSKARHIVLESPDSLDLPVIHGLISLALAKARIPVDPARPGKLVIKAVADNQRPRRPSESLRKKI